MQCQVSQPEERNQISLTKPNKQLLIGKDYLPPPIVRQQQALLFSRQMTLQQSLETSGDKVVAVFSPNYSQGRKFLEISYVFLQDT